MVDMFQRRGISLRIVYRTHKGVKLSLRESATIRGGGGVWGVWVHTLKVFERRVGGKKTRSSVKGVTIRMYTIEGSIRH